jgi:arginine repressor
MKTNQRIYILAILIIGAITLYIGSSFTNQEKTSTESSDFVISIKTNDNKIILECEKGCAWKELTYTLIEGDEMKVVDEYGVGSLDSVSKNKDKSLADFLFKVEKTKQGLKLKGMEGTAWVELSFSLAENRFQRIDNLGMLK